MQSLFWLPAASAANAILVLLRCPPGFAILTQGDGPRHLAALGGSRELEGNARAFGGEGTLEAHGIGGNRATEISVGELPLMHPHQFAAVLLQQERVVRRTLNEIEMQVPLAGE